MIIERMMQRNMNFQTIGWFWDLFKRELLVMDPPYQRRSVWNQEYKDYFVDTVLHGYPAPAIFLYRETTPEGVTKYSVVDGKQRLSTLFDFASNVFSISDRATIARFRGRYFKDLDDSVKTDFWNYQFAVESLPSSDEEIINNIFDRINRNVAKLTPQELRHARFGGAFISQVANLSEWMTSVLPQNFPNISPQSRKQMKDDEFTSQLLLLIEEGPKTYSQDDLDQAFSDRDEAWENSDLVITRFHDTVEVLRTLVSSDRGQALARTRLRNQADFYSLFGAVSEMVAAGDRISPWDVLLRLESFVKVVEDPDKRADSKEATNYFEAARSASNDAGPRRIRLDIMKDVLTGAVRI